MENRIPFYEFFAGGGLARIGLGSGWTCLFANDICRKKGAVYRNNFAGGDELIIDDINNIDTAMLPGEAFLAWASFPCQDLSLAGSNKGLNGQRSGAFWPFWKLMADLEREGRRMPCIVLENVVGLLSSKKGEDFQTLCTLFTEAGYRLGALVIDGVHFVAQSRPRLFIVAIHESQAIPESVQHVDPNPFWHPPRLVQTYKALSKSTRDSWIWWHLPEPPPRKTHLKSCLEGDPVGVKWHSADETQKILSMMSTANIKKVKQAQATGRLQVGTIYKRTRVEQGEKRQRAEVRFDGISGCLRTPAGGSSRQTLLFVEKGVIRSRLLSPREAARLMGLPEDYQLPGNYNEAYRLMGDAVVVPAISWLERHILKPMAITKHITLETAI